MVRHLLLLPLFSAAVAAQTIPPPTSQCAGCGKAAVLNMHIVSKNFCPCPPGAVKRH
jgi:hypothetical protein